MAKKPFSKGKEKADDVEKTGKTIKAGTLKELCKQINKEHGEDGIINGSAVVKVKSFPTGILSIDLASGCGGIPQGRIIEIFGSESSGKTTFCLTVAAACQKHYFEDKKRHGVVAFIDAEHALDISWAKKLGVSFEEDRFLVAQPNNGNDASDIIKHLCESAFVDLIIIDSVAALQPKSIIDGDFDDANIGAHAKLIGKLLSRINPFIKNGTTVLLTNQIRNKIGVMFGNPEDTTGGKSLKFYTSMRISLRNSGKVKDGDIQVANNVHMTYAKNKVGIPYATCEFKIHFTDNLSGIDPIEPLLRLSPEITRNGNFYKYGNINLGNGPTAATMKLLSEPDLCDEIMKKTYSNLVQVSISENDLDNDPILDGDIDGDTNLSD